MKSIKSTDVLLFLGVLASIAYNVVKFLIQLGIIRPNTAGRESEEAKADQVVREN